jgi:hypothetical protein
MLPLTLTTIRVVPKGKCMTLATASFLSTQHKSAISPSRFTAIFMVMLVSAGLFLAIGKNASATNILVNPGMEDGLNNWTTFGAGFNTSVQTNFTHSGTNAFKVFGQFITVTNYSGMFQDFTSGSGAVYNVSGWMYTPTSDALAGGNQCWFEFSFRDCFDDILVVYKTPIISTNSPTGTWINLSTNNLVAPAGTSFARFQVTFQQPPDFSGGSVWADDMDVEQVGGSVPPNRTINFQTPTYANPFVSTSASFSFTASSSASAIQTNGILVLLNGVDVSSQLVVSGSTSNCAVSFTGLAANADYNAYAQVPTVDGGCVNGTWFFGTYSQGNYTFEAEDYDFSGGQFYDSPILSSAPGPNNYFGNTNGILEIDEHVAVVDSNAVYAYRPVTNHTATLVADDILRQTYLDAEVADPSVTDYKAGFLYAGSWLNYTRHYPAGNWNVYARLSGGGAFSATLGKVTNGIGTSNQTIQTLGTFTGAGSSFTSYDFIPLVDASGNLVTVSLTGAQTTLRATTGGGCDMNYFMLIPAVGQLTVTPSKSGSNFVLTFPTVSGHGYWVTYKDNMSDANWKLLGTVTGDGTVKVVNDPVAPKTKRFYRLMVP